MGRAWAQRFALGNEAPGFHCGSEKLVVRGAGWDPVYNCGMAKRVIHITEAEAAGDFASLLERVRAGEEVVIERDERPVAVVRPAESALRLLSESLCLARQHGSTITLDPGFAKDVEAAVASHREPLSPPAWD